MQRTTKLDADGIDLTGEVVHELPRRDRDADARGESGPAELSGRLAGLSLHRQVLVLSVWPLLEQLMNFLVGTVDLVMAGHLGAEALAVSATDALGVSGYVGWLMTMIHSGAGVGASALIARAMGARRQGLANAALGQAVLLALCSGAVVCLSVYGLAQGIGRLAGVSGLGLELCTIYLRIVALAAPASAVLLVANACLRGAGDTRWPFTVMVLVNVINIVLSVLFVFGPAPLGGHGVAGIAAGTACAWTIGALVLLVVLARGNGALRLRWARLRPHLHTARRIVRVAVPNLFESAGALWLGHFLVLMIVGRLAQEAVLGAHMIVLRIEAISFLPGAAMGVAAATLAGQYLGLGDPHRARRAVFICWAWSAAIMGVLGLVFVAIPHVLVRLITDAGALTALAPTPLRICGPFQVFLATHMVLAAAQRGAGDTRAVFWTTAITTFAVRVPVVYFIAIVLDLGLNGVWYGICVDMTVRGIVFWVSFSRGRWARVRV